MKAESAVVLFADISGSTQLFENLGENQAQETLGKCISAVSQAVENNNGTVVKTIGDEVLATFPAVESAVLSAASIVQAVDQMFPEPTARLEVSIGLHFGQVLVEDGDVFGDTVNIASRLVKMANPGQVLTSKFTVEHLPEGLSSKTRAMGSFPLKGKRDVMSVYEILLLEAQQDPEMTMVSGKGHTVERVKVYLLLRHGKTELTLHEEGQTVLIGRDPDHELTVDNKLASRNHAQIEYTKGQFVLSDHSTNGTFVLNSEGETTHLNRENFLLQGVGQISLGQDFAENPTELIQFFLQQSE
ncbi:MAG: adenylate/guanylate cyclase domain-containing protein [Acidobacteriota bacterium]